MFNVTLSSYNEYGATGSQAVSWKSCYGIDELIKMPPSVVTGADVVSDKTGVGRRVAHNEVIIDVDQDVSYLGSYLHSKV